MGYWVGDLRVIQITASGVRGSAWQVTGRMEERDVLVRVGYLKWVL